MTNDEILQAAKEAEQALYNRSFTAYFCVVDRLVRETEKRTIERCAVVAGWQVDGASAAIEIRKLGEQ